MRSMLPLFTESCRRRYGAVRMMLIVAMACITAVYGAGCASTSSSQNRHSRNSLAGFEFELMLRDETGSEALYRVDRDGNISFGGGLDARLGKTSWTGAMTDDELRELRDLLAAQDWFRQKPVATDEPRQRVYAVSLHAPENRTRFRVRGENQQLEPLRAFLHRLSLRRLEDDLNRLPQPGLQRR